MKIKQITSSRCQKNLKNLYESSFPENERVPFEMLFNKETFPTFKLYTFNNDKELVGFAYLLIEEKYKIAFLGYIAVKNTLRRQTYGSQIIDFLKSNLSDYVIAVNIESTNNKADNQEEREMRERFYLKNGFKFAGVEFENRDEDFSSYYWGDFNQKDYVELMKNYFPELKNLKISKI